MLFESVGTRFEHRLFGEQIFKRAVFLDLNGEQLISTLTPENIAKLKYVKDIRSEGGLFNDSNLHQLTSLAELETLYIGGKDITNDSIPTFAKMQSLKRLKLNWSSIRKPDLSLLTKLSQLHRLELNNCRITDDQYESLAAMKSLETLSLENCEMSFDVAMKVAGLPRLKQFKISGERLSWEQVKEIFEVHHHLNQNFH